MTTKLYAYFERYALCMLRTTQHKCEDRIRVSVIDAKQTKNQTLTVSYLLL